MSRDPVHRHRGFTLIELVVAVAVFALAMALAYGGLDALLRARRQLEEESRSLQQLQFSIALLERDVRSAVPRAVRDAYGAPLPAVLARGGVLELTRGGLGSGLTPRRPQLERVAWLLDRGQLTRRNWSALDRAPGNQPNTQVLLPEVTAFSVEALSAAPSWMNEWPPRQARVDALPRALRIRVSGPAFGDIERVLELPVERRP